MQLTLDFIPTPALCNRCNAEHDKRTCANCGCHEFRLTGIEAREMAESSRIKPKRKARRKA